MKTPKSRKKSFRVDCGSCHATQDSLRYACAQCKQRLYTNVEQDELEGVVANVAEMEAILSELEKPSPQKGNPYDPVDKAWSVYRGLRRFQFLPGMPAYLDGVLEALLPFKVKLLQRTVKANWMFLVVLVIFPIVAALFGLPMMIVGLLALPPFGWLWVALKAGNDLKKTKAKLTQILAS
jgi:hypothetical protein